MTGQNGEAREQIARAIAGKYWERALGDADAVLATPAVAEALAAVERVRALAEELDRRPASVPDTFTDRQKSYCDGSDAAMHATARRLRRALDGDHG